MLPSACPLGDDGSQCRVVAHHRRARKTGPAFPLTVARCALHKVAFTLYPPGHMPYGQVALTPVDPAGRPIRGKTSDDHALSGTLWEAASDARDGARWPEQAGHPASRRTQGRRLATAESILGLGPGGGHQAIEIHAFVLGIPTLTLHERRAPGSGEARASDSWRHRATRVMEVLKTVFRTGRSGGLMRAGHAAQLWGAPRRWDPGGLHVAAR